jgi:hypothetical protein
MRRRFEHEGVWWEVELTGTGGEGCGAHILDVRFIHPSTGAPVPGRLVLRDAGRLTDELLRLALAEALEA